MRKHVKIVKRINVVRDTENNSVATTADRRRVQSRVWIVLYSSPRMQMRVDNQWKSNALFRSPLGYFGTLAAALFNNNSVSPTVRVRNTLSLFLSQSLSLSIYLSFSCAHTRRGPTHDDGRVCVCVWASKLVWRLRTRNKGGGVKTQWCTTCVLAEVYKKRKKKRFPPVDVVIITIIVV